METLKYIPQISENLIQIGSNRFNNYDLVPFSNFKGCISSMYFLCLVGEILL